MAAACTPSVRTGSSHMEVDVMRRGIAVVVLAVGSAVAVMVATAPTHPLRPQAQGALACWAV
jgi:hypothetical protein